MPARATCSRALRRANVWRDGRVLAFAIAFAGLLGCVAARAAENAALPLERGLPLVRTFAPRDFDGTNQVWATVFARDGTAYFGNKGQVLEFDGLTWSAIAVRGGAHVRGLAIDSDDVLWVGGVDEVGRIVRDASGRRVYESLRSLVPESVGDLKDIWSVFATEQGIWFQSNQAVLCWRNGKFDVWMLRERFITLSFWLGDHLLVARSNGWFRPAPNGDWTQVGDPAAKLGDLLPHFAVPHPAGGWLMGLEGPKGEVVGLARWDGAKLTPETHALDPFFKAKRFYSATRLRDGRYVITTLQGGAVVLGPDLQWQTWLNQRNGLPTDTVISAKEDAHGALWLGMELGIARVLLHPAYSSFNNANGLSPNNPRSLVRWRGNLYVGAVNGLTRFRASSEVPSVATLERESDLDDKVMTIVQVRDELIVGGLGAVWSYDGKTATKLRALTNVFEILASRVHPDYMFAASINGVGIFKHDGTRWNYQGVISDARGATIEESTDGTLWLGSDNGGAVRVQFPGNDLGAKPVITRLGAAAGLPSSGKVRVRRLGERLVFLSDEGLYRFDDASARFTVDAALGRRFADGTMTIDDLVADGRGGAWVIARPAGASGPNRIKQLAYANGESWQPVALPNVERLEGYSSLRWEIVEGRELLWVNCQTQVLRVDLTEWRARGDLPAGKIVLHGITTAAGAPIPGADRPRPELRPEQNSVRFRFGAPALAGEINARYETRLRGFGDGAPEVTTLGLRTFTNLPAGDYVFEARGRASDGRWSDTATLAFRVLAPWWQTPWAWSGYALLLGAGVYGIVRRRTRTLERERLRLESIVSARTAELAEKNQELERLNQLEQDEKLSARLAEEKARLELLRYQLNPHFLFNSLNSIRALVYANPDAAGEMVTRLAEFCRWTLTRGSDETTTVADEVEMVRTYLDIEKVRWQEALITTLEVDETARAERLPQFLLLPLIENAIKYGGRTSPRTLEVRVTIRLAGDALTCEVANTGTWVESNGERSATSTHIGLENLRQRLARHYGAAWKLEIAPDAGWVRVQLRMKRGLPAEPKRAPSTDPFAAH